MDSYALKIRRAEEHLLALRQEETDYIRSNPARILTEPDHARGIISLRFVVDRHPPETWGPLIGDILFNLRSSLDHLVYQMTVRHSGVPLPHTSFPIYEVANDYHASRPNGNPARNSGLYKVRGIPDEAKAMVEFAQPYHNEDGVRRDALWLINHLNNIDKHRTIHVAVAYPYEANTTFNLPMIQESVSAGPFTHGAVIATYSVEGDSKLDEVIATTNLVSQVVLDEGDPPITRPLVAECQTLLDAVAHDTIPAFMDFL
jgi:hypothetical protein